uniref:Uncharacterized protein n=1 Tax=Anopheles merus TaxID=30066 RepID=A0A182VMH6_ANOME
MGSSVSTSLLEISSCTQRLLPTALSSWANGGPLRYCPRLVLTQTSFAPSASAPSPAPAPLLSSVLFSLFSSSSSAAAVVASSSPVAGGAVVSSPFLCSGSGAAGAASFRNTSRLSTSLAMSKSS